MIKAFRQPQADLAMSALGRKADEGRMPFDFLHLTDTVTKLEK
jgi:hypothetical protein